jgi:hypothetical protein
MTVIYSADNSVENADKASFDDNEQGNGRNALNTSKVLDGALYLVLYLFSIVYHVTRLFLLQGVLNLS